MDKELIDRAWSCLPREFKEEVKDYYEHPDCCSLEECVLENIFGEHNLLSSDTEGEEMLSVSRKKVQGLYDLVCEIYADGTKEWYQGYMKAMQDLFGSKCLPDEKDSATCQDKTCKNYDTVNGHCRFIEHCSYEPKPAEPKFKVGDKVRILSLHGRTTPDKGEVDVIVHINIRNREQMYYLENHYHCAYGFSESDLELYTEPTETCTDDCPSPCPSQDFDDIINQSFESHNRLHIAAMLAAGMLANDVRCYPVDRAFELADKLIKKSKEDEEQ